jgi:hypothetical protein
MAGKGEAIDAASGPRRYHQVLRALLLALEGQEAGAGPDLATSGIAPNGRG